jgi:hypothetical protein
MDRLRFVPGFVLVLLLSASHATGQSESAPTDAPEAEAESPAEAARIEALAMLEEASDYLATLKTYAFEAEFAYDAVQTTGQKLEFGGTREILVRRPDRVRSIARDREGSEATLYFDGKTIAVDLPDENAYVLVEKSGTLNEIIDYIVNDLGTPMPFDDLVYENFYARLAPLVTHGFVVGEETVGGVLCTHLAFTTEGADVEVWIDAGERPLIRRFVIGYDRARRPQFRAQIREWDLSPRARDSAFTYRPPKGAERLSVAVATDLREQRASEAAGGQP